MESNEQSFAAPAVSDRVSRAARFHSRLHRYQSLLKRLWWAPALTMMLGLGIKAIVAWYAPFGYTSVGQMIVSMKITIPEGSIYTEELSNFLGTQVALMQSGAVRSRATEWLAANRPELLPTQVDLQVSVIPKTTIFVLRATGGDPEYTQAYLDACMNAYIELKREMRSQTSETTLAGITQELGRLERELRRTEDELANFLASNSVVLLQEQGISASTYLADLNRQLADLRTEFQLLGALSVEQNLERRPFTAAGTKQPNLLEGDTEYLKARQEVQMLKAEAQGLSEYLRPKHPKIVAIQEDIARRERLLEYYREQSREQLESRRSSIELQIQNLDQLAKEWEARSLEASRKMADYQKLQAAKQRIQSLYDRLLGTMQTVDVNKGISPESVNIMENASPARISQGNLTKEFAVAGFLGLLAGLGLLFVIDRLDDRITNLTEFEEHFEEPVVGQILKDPVSSVRNDLAMLIKQTDDRHSLIEAFRNLRSALLFMPGKAKEPRVLLVTSSIPNDGKSFVASNLAISMAMGGSRVLLVDGDLRKGMLHERFGVEMHGGVAEALAGSRPWTTFVRTTSHPNLFLLPRGQASDRSSELFISPAAADFLREVREQYDHVVLDTPPVMAADDVTSLAPRTDGVVFVIRANQTSGRVARAALELLYQRGVNVLGVVLNAVEASGGDYYYYKYRDYHTSYPAK